MVGDVSGVKQHYISKNGVYLQGDGTKEYDYSEKVNDIQENDEQEEELTFENVNIPELNNSIQDSNNEVISI